MEVEFKSSSFAFRAKFNESETAKKISELLPLETSVFDENGKICFAINVDVASCEFAKTVNKGDVIYFPEEKILCVFCRSREISNIFSEYPFIIVGSTVVSHEELREILPAKKVLISLRRPKYSFGERILSQEEIDEIVKKLLAEKKKA